jgi:general secretion pathway protein G
MLLPDAERKRHKRKDRDRDETPDGMLPSFHPGRNPTILGGIIVVFIILGTLLTSQLETPRTERQQSDPVSLAWRDMETLMMALERFYRDTGRYPTEPEGLVALVRDPGIPGWGGHYVNLIRPDPWKTPYHYTLTAAGPAIRSAGPDRSLGTTNDIYLALGSEDLGIQESHPVDGSR